MCQRKSQYRTVNVCHVVESRLHSKTIECWSTECWPTCFTDHPSSKTGNVVGNYSSTKRFSQLAKRQAALIIVAYLSFWSPYNLLAAMLTFADEGSLKEAAYATLPFLNSLIVMNPIVNPVIYGLFDRT